MSCEPLFVLDQLRKLGPFFVLRTGVRSEPLRSSGTQAAWRPVADLLDDTPSGARRIDHLIDEVHDRLTGTGQPPPGTKPWIAASILQLGWAARLTSIYAGSLALGAAVPDVAASTAYYRLLGYGRVELGVEEPVALDAETGWKHITDDHLYPLGEAIQRRIRLGRRLLDGNIASALSGSLAMLARAGHAPLEALIDQPWASPPGIASLGSWQQSPAGPRYTRTTCCGYDRLPQGSRCRDCGRNRRGRP